MQTTTLYLILFFHGVITRLTRYYRTWFPLIYCHSCEVIGDFYFRHIMIYIYVTKSDYHEFNLRYKETDSSMNNNFLIKYTAENDEERIVSGNILSRV